MNVSLNYMKKGPHLLTVRQKLHVRRKENANNSFPSYHEPAIRRANVERKKR